MVCPQYSLPIDHLALQRSIPISIFHKGNWGTRAKWSVQSHSRSETQLRIDHASPWWMAWTWLAAEPKMILWYCSLKQRGQCRTVEETETQQGLGVGFSLSLLTWTTAWPVFFSLWSSVSSYKKMSKQSGLRDACRDFASCHQLFFTLGEHAPVTVRKTLTYGRIWRRRHRAACTAGSAAPCNKQAARKSRRYYEWRGSATQRQALTKMQTDIVLALVYDHLMYNGNVTYLWGLMGALMSNNPSSVCPQLT